ncbi:pilus assembly protein TadG-related protein [Agromyces soli]
MSARPERAESDRAERDRTGAREDGSTLLLTIFYGVLALALVLVVVAASSLYLERKRLFTLADGAALAAAEAWQLDEVRIDGDALRLELDDEGIADEALAYLADAGGGTAAGPVELVRAASDDAQSATVTLRTIWRAPFSLEFLPFEVPIEVTATARSVFH